MQWIDNLPWGLVIAAAVLLGLAPFVPEPHLLEKLRMLSQGNLRRPLDIFDLLYHSLPIGILAVKVIRALLLKQ